jgi:hypothetical protein
MPPKGSGVWSIPSGSVRATEFHTYLVVTKHGHETTQSDRPNNEFPGKWLTGEYRLWLAHWLRVAFAPG